MNKLLFYAAVAFSGLSLILNLANAEISENKAVKEFKILIIGDSISEGYGVAKEKAYPTILEKKLRALRPQLKIINASISGSTSASALKRVKWQLKMKPDMIILALGANDGLRGLKVEATEENLQKAIEAAKSQGIKVVLGGMKLPINYGEKYRSDFEAIFTHLAKKNGIDLIPFILEGVGGIAAYNQADGIHPNEKGHERIAEHIFTFLKDLL